MTTVAFREFQGNNRADALTIEDVYKHYAAFAGVHNFEFVDDIDSFDASKWDAIANISYASGYLERTDVLGSDTPTWYTEALPHSYTIEFTAHEEAWAYYCRADATGTNNNSFLIEYSSSDAFIRFTERIGGVDTILLYKELIEEELVDWGRVKITVRDEQFNSEDTGRIIYLSVWVNDNMIAAIGDNVYEGNPPLYQGFVIPAGATGIVYSDLRVANLGEVIIWSSLDPGEKAIGAIQRAMEDRYIRQWMRWNGSLKAWKPKARAVAATIEESREYGNAPVTDLKQVITTIKVLGAFQWVQVYDKDLVRDFGRIHSEISNTSLWNADDCARIGLDILRRVKEQVYQIRFVTGGLPFIEYEDRISVPDPAVAGAFVDYIVDAPSWNYEDGVLKIDIAARRYYYGEPD